jgi:hypothetical protein
MFDVDSERVHTEVDVTETAAANLTANAVLVADSQILDRMSVKCMGQTSLADSQDVIVIFECDVEFTEGIAPSRGQIRRFGVANTDHGRHLG